MNKDTNNDKNTNAMETIKEVGTLDIPDFNNPIQFLTIIGEVEGHTLSPSDKKTTKYEHIIPILIASMQNPKIKEYL